MLLFGDLNNIIYWFVETCPRLSQILWKNQYKENPNPSPRISKLRFSGILSSPKWFLHINRRSSILNYLITLVNLLYVRVNQENEALGKVGLAVIRNDEQIRIILYRTKQIVLSTLSLQSTSIVYNKKDYVQYQDDDHSFWSLRFEMNDRETFLKTIDQHCTVEYEQVEAPALKHDATIIVDNKNDIECNKLSIVNRMAKMGHQLPQMKRSIELPDAEVEEVKDTTVSYRPVVPKWKPDIPSREMFPYAGTANTNTPILASSTLISYNPNMMTAESGINSFLAENRIQNSEVRMNLSKLETKIERVMDKIDALNMEKQPRRKLDSEDEILRLEEKILALKKENRQFRLSIEELKEREQKQKRNGDAELLEAANRQNAELQMTLDSKVAEVKRLGSEIREQSTRFHALQSDFAKLQRERLSEIAAKSAELDVLRKQLDGQTADVENKVTLLEASLASRISEISTLKSQADKERDELSSKIQALHKEAEKNDQISVGDTVKEIMNNLYQKLQDQLADRGELGAQEVLKITRILIKKETTAALGLSAV